MFLRRGTAPHRTRMSDLEIGRRIKLNLNGTPWEFLVVHQGLPSAIYDDSCNGTWLLMKDIYENRVWQSGNINKYERSDIHAYLNSTFLNLFDSNIKDAIKQVKIPYRKDGGSGGTNQSGANGLSAKIFLLSGYEVGWTTSDDQYFPQDGAKLSYFESGTGTSANNKRIANLNGSAARWWLRSPYTGNSNSVWCVYSSGNYNGIGASRSSGIRPAIILPSDMLVTDDMLA
nr:MAG TPA: tail protein [Caudoviricetes sp.]